MINIIDESSKLQIGLIASHNGSTAGVIIDACFSGEIPCDPCVLISNNSRSGARLRAEQATIPFVHLSTVTHPNDLDKVMVDTLKKHNVGLVCLAGYMKKLGPCMIKYYSGRILNVHPSLLPKFGGQGYYGIRVHKAVIDAGESESGATIHFVDRDYDKGRILAQARVSVNRHDTPEQLQKRVRGIEHMLYVKALKKIVSSYSRE